MRQGSRPSRTASGQLSRGTRTASSQIVFVAEKDLPCIIIAIVVVSYHELQSSRSVLRGFGSRGSAARLVRGSTTYRWTACRAIVALVAFHQLFGARQPARSPSIHNTAPKAGSPGNVGQSFELKPASVSCTRDARAQCHGIPVLHWRGRRTTASGARTASGQGSRQRQQWQASGKCNGLLSFHWGGRRTTAAGEGPARTASSPRNRRIAIPQLVEHDTPSGSPTLSDADV